MISQNRHQKIKYDKSITIAVGKSRKETDWKNREMLWSEFVEKLGQTTRTRETLEEFLKLPKTQQDSIKDVGGFVGGALKGGRRIASNVAWRQVLTLDADFAGPGFWDLVGIMLGDCSCLIYSTHKHRPQKPRLRLVIPLARPVTPDEYQAISRRIAADIGVDLFDDTTYQPHRLMYWPSTAADGEFIFECQDGCWIEPDEVLRRYPDWRDQSFWPESTRTVSQRKRDIDKQGDPHEKKGIIGAFCRSYTIAEAIETFLSDVYEACDIEGRYTYKQGSTAAGLIIYENGKFAYSHHGTDPVSGKLVNSFDLVRLHKFGESDESVRSDTKINNLPSYKSMTEFALNDDNVKIQLGKEKRESAKEDFDIVENDNDEINDNWLAELDYTQRGEVKGSINNVKIILEKDKWLKEKLAYNEFSLRNIVKGKLPWEKSERIRPWDDNDESGLRHYLEKMYGITRATQMINDATRLVFKQNKFHPVRDYLNSLHWDGTKRIEMLLIDYFGVEDNIYTRAAARIFVCGGVARIFYPGCQLDYVLTLAGPQGINKSTFFKIMAKEDDWFTESTTIKTKESIEETMGKWIVEMAEMAPTKKSEVEEMKAFITNKSKTVRLAYARNPVDVLRQFVLVASTNESAFLKDPTGNRRYLPVDANMENANKSIKKHLKAEIDQLWAEAVVVYKDKKEKAIMLSDEEEKLAKEEQENHRIIDDEEGTIVEFLDTPLPNNWYDLDLYERQNYFRDSLAPKVKKEDGFIRDRICVKEIANECFGISGRVDLKESHRINKIMQGLRNWAKQKTSTRISGYGTQRGYYRK